MTAHTAAQPNGAEATEPTARAKRPTTPNGSVGRLNEAPGPSKPMRVARHYLWANHEHRPDTSQALLTQEVLSTLHHWRGSWMAWENGCWKERENLEMTTNLYAALEHAKYKKTPDGAELVPWNPNRRNIGDVLDALRSVSHLRARVAPPAFLDPETDSPGTLPSPVRKKGFSWIATRDPMGIIACRNGLLDIATRTLHPHTPRFFNLHCVPFDWNPHAPTPTKWLAFLNQLWPDDPQSIAALQQFFGYVLSGRTDLQKMLLIASPPRGGKGTISRILKMVVGEGNSVGLTLSSLAQNFGLAPLVNKSLAVLSDARPEKGFGGQSSRVLERLLSISGEDDLPVDRKNRDMWNGKLPCRIIVLSNELPRFTDASGAIASRFVLLNLTQSWLGKEDKGLFGRLCEELPGILAWALDGLDALNRQGHFTEPEASRDARETLAELTSPQHAFVTAHCLTGPEHKVPMVDLFRAWETWCAANGQHAGSLQTFAKDIRATVAGLRTERPRAGVADATRPRVIVGIALDPDRAGPVMAQRPQYAPPPAAVAPCEHNLGSLCPICRPVSPSGPVSGS